MPVYRHLFLTALLCSALLQFPVAAAGPPSAHTLEVDIEPGKGIRVTDRVQVPAGLSSVEFRLNAGLAIESAEPAARLLGETADGLHKRYRVDLADAGRRFTLHYAGMPRFADTRRLGGMPQGEVSDGGTYLDGASAWYPVLDGVIEGIDMTVRAPDGWHSLGIGRRNAGDGLVRWSSEVPHDDIYLLAAPYVRYTRRHGDIDLSVLLLEPDGELADRYLKLTGDYIDHYASLFGPYPFAKFAVVENRWETGYGMPSFTLLGSRVLRLPFIPYTSLPHEVLHNWLGNGIWIDHRKGNWAEGLTAYLADHWMQERRGNGAAYRLRGLQRYTNFAADGRDAPLLTFTQRHDDTSQSIGYDKSLMVFHMLRRQMGEDDFMLGLQRLWERHRFQSLGFVEALTAIAGRTRLRETGLDQWIEAPDAPRLNVQAADLSDDGLVLRLAVHQDAIAPFRFNLPIAITYAPGEAAEWHSLAITGTLNEVTLRLPRRPLRVDIDPAYDVLRYLDHSEQPPTLNRLFSGTTWLVLPTETPESMARAWIDVAESWQRRYPGLRTISDAEAETLPDGASMLVLGWNNRLLSRAAQVLSAGDQQLSDAGLTLAGRELSARGHSVVLTAARADGSVHGFIGAGNADMVRDLGRRLPHFGSFGRIVFDNANGKVVQRDRLQAAHSPMSFRFDTQAPDLRLPQRRAL